MNAPPVAPDELPPGYSLLSTEDRGEVILIRILVGWIFLSQGVQRFLFPETRGSGLFEHHRIPLPELSAPVVGGFEIVCALLVLAGLGVRIAIFPLITLGFLSITRVKLPILLSQGFWPGVNVLRVDVALLLCGFYLMWVGGGKGSMDLRIWRAVTDDGTREDAA